jgi:hypothetical protein
VNDFAIRERERAEEQFRQLIQNAEIENECIDHACELIEELEAYLRQKSLKVTASRASNVVILTRENACTLRISIQDHRTYEVTGGSAIIDEHRRTHLSRIKKRQMMDEVLNWLRD